MKFTYLTVVLSAFTFGNNFSKNNETYYNKQMILSETQWNDMKVETNAPSHLSVISQGYITGLNGKYDKNYYYPASAGEDIDVYMFDFGFNYSYEELDDVNANIIAVVSQKNVTKPDNDKVLYSGIISDHGTMTSAAVTGKIHGTAKKANIHGIHFDDDSVVSDISLLAALEYVRDNVPIKPHKTIFNFAVGGYPTISEFENGETSKKIRDVLNEFAEKGVVLVSVAGNMGIQAYDEQVNRVSVPCVFDNVICVGGVGNFNIPGIMDGEIDSSYYTIAKYKINEKQYLSSNYGKGVDIYAPFAFHYRGKFKNSDYVEGYFNIHNSDYDVEETEYGPIITNLDKLLPGTSFASPLVTGVAATIMSENKDIKFDSKSMLDYLTKIGEKDIIQGVPEGCSNVFINNGKKIVFDADPNAEVEEPNFSSDDEDVIVSGKDLIEDNDSDDENVPKAKADSE